MQLLTFGYPARNSIAVEGIENAVTIEIFLGIAFAVAIEVPAGDAVRSVSAGGTGYAICSVGTGCAVVSLATGDGKGEE